MSQKEKKNKRDNANMLNNKVFFLFFNTKYKQRIHTYLKQSSGQTRSPGNPSGKRKAGVCFSLFVKIHTETGICKN